MPLPDPSLADPLAQAQATMEAAQAAHLESTEHVATILRRMAETEESQCKITEKRLAGTATETDTAEFSALATDVVSLRASLAEAESAVAARQTELDAAEHRLADAQGAWDRHQACLRLEVLKGKASELEALLVACLRELNGEAQTTGIRIFSAVWHPSEALHKAVAFRMAP